MESRRFEPLEVPKILHSSYSEADSVLEIGTRRSSMRYSFKLLVFLMLGLAGICGAQDATPPSTDASATGETEAQPATSKTPDSKTDQTENRLVNQVEAEAEKIAKQVDQLPEAKKAAAGILQPIYVVAEALAFSTFHWLAFALMTAGVFSYALQLVLGKLVVLMRLGFSLKEILSDAVGLAISVFGLVLTTQAAAENSTFTQSPAAVISATVVGAVAGFVLYLWGQSQELQAVAGRSRQAASRKP
jgi:hypothetical protein